MANPARGEFCLSVDNTEYTIAFSTNAICELEARLDKGLNAIVIPANMERLTTVRALLWAALRAKHPDVTIQQAGEIIDKIGMPQVIEVVSKALTAWSPVAKADAKNG